MVVREGCQMLGGGPISGEEVLKHILRKPESVVRLRARPRCLSRMTATRWRCLAVFLALLPASWSEFDLALRGDRGPRPSGRRITRRKGTSFWVMFSSLARCAWPNSVGFPFSEAEKRTALLHKIRAL